jgi:uncharacterized protein YndB with AHSA1/START domain
MSTDEFTAQLRIGATPSEVFPYLTDSELMVRWMGNWADLDPTVGGQFVVDINGVPVRGEFLAVEPPHRVVFTWGMPGNDRMPAGSTTVEITLRSEGNETVLELVHRDLPPEELEMHGVGWDHVFERLAVAAVGGDPGPDPWSMDSV